MKLQIALITKLDQYKINKKYLKKDLIVFFFIINSNE